MIAKKSIETGEDCDSIPESMRQYLAMQFDPSKPGGRDLFGRAGGLGGYGAPGALSGDGSHSGKIGKLWLRSWTIFLDYMIDAN